MIRLTREVRFSATDPFTGQSPNGFGGVPALESVGVWLALRVTLEGTLDPDSSYLRNIKEIDAQVRARAVPVVARLVASRRMTHAQALQALADTLRDAWDGTKVVGLELVTSPFQSIEINPSEPQMMRLSQQFEFSAAHRLHNPELDDETNRQTFGKCNNPHGHGHNYVVKVTLAGTPDDTGTLMPVTQFEQIVDAHAIDLLDHKHLNLEVEAFRTLNPSVENIAMTIYRMLQTPLARPNCRLASVTVWETPKTFAEYAE